MCESLSILSQIFFLCRNLKVLSRQSFVFLLRSLLQVCSHLSRLENLMLLLASIETSYCYCDSILPFSMKTLSQQSFLCCDNIWCIPQTIMSQHNFSAASTSWCRDPSFHVATTSLFRLCCNTVLYYLHFCRDPESLS